MCSLSPCPPQPGPVNFILHLLICIQPMKAAACHCHMTPKSQSCQAPLSSSLSVSLSLSLSPSLSLSLSLFLRLSPISSLLWRFRCVRVSAPPSPSSWRRECWREYLTHTRARPHTH